VSGPVEGLTSKIENVEGVEYLVVTAGQFDLLCEVLVADDSALLSITNQLRSIPGVINTETFVYLDLVKQNYEWGAH
jgi:Lrp/AsnC family transcriptional regulator for asnA, asnC and gidA